MPKPESLKTPVTLVGGGIQILAYPLLQSRWEEGKFRICHHCR